MEEFDLVNRQILLQRIAEKLIDHIDPAAMLQEILQQAVEMLDAAIRNADSNAPKDISAALKRLRAVPTVGGVVSVDANGDMRQSVSLFSLDGRTWKRLPETAETSVPQEPTPELR